MKRALLWLPKGGGLTDDAWWQRHRAILVLLWLHAVGLTIFGVAAGFTWQHSLAEGSLVALAAIPAGSSRFGRRLRSGAATLGLVTASALLVHLTNGLIEAHFHFFVMLAVVAMYQDWLPFLLGIGFVVVEHGTVGVLLPHQVYDHPEAWDDPWRWALIHGVFVLGLCAANVVQWRFAEVTQAERRRAAEAQARLAAIVTSSDDAIMSSDRQGLLTSWNAGAERLFGYSQAEILGRPIARLLPTDRPDQLAELRERLVEGDPAHQIELLNARRDGSLVHVSVSVSPILDEAGQHIGYAYIARDITERKRAEESLVHQARHDALTNLPNRVLLRERLSEAIERAHTGDGRAALLVLDLDRFKEVNDTFGHQHGDQLLQELAERLASQQFAWETIARLGGDEFAVLLPDADAEVALRRAEELRIALSAPFVLQGYGVDTGASIGIALAPEHGPDADSLLKCADVAMYTAKRAGGGIALYAPEHDQHSPDRLALVGQLRQAIEQDGLVLHYQPKLDCRTGVVTGVEALVRWMHAERGLLPPDQFISIAEQAGLIGRMTEWVIAAALRQSHAWRQQGIVLPVAINLSMRSLHDPDLPDLIQRALSRWGLPPAALELELTESSLMADPGRALAVLTRLSSMGLRISVDDFGTGYSSLSYLKRLPVHELKMDRSFVRDMMDEPRDRAIVQSTIDLAHHLGLHVVAEGVEDQATWDLLRRIGCDVAQGFHLGRPQPPQKLEGWLSSLLATSSDDTFRLAA